MTELPPTKPPFEQPGRPAQKEGGAGLAIAALVLGICGIIPLLGIAPAIAGIILGIVALALGTRGKGMAVAGIIVGFLAGVGVNLLLVVAIGLPQIARARDMAGRARCGVNLHNIGLAIAMYSEDHKDQFPLLWPEGDPNAGLDTVTARGVSEIRSTNAMNNFWLLVGGDYLDNMETLRCYSDKGWVERPAGSFGWTDLRQCSYGLQWPYRGDGAKANPAAPWPYQTADPFPKTAEPRPAAGLASVFVLVADRNPRGGAPDSSSPSNHKGGQNVLHVDNSVRFYKDSSTSGPHGDDIYANAAGVPGGIPTAPTDISITPVPSR